MRISRGSLVTVVAVLALAVILGSACAAPAAPPTVPPPVTAPNEAPVISTITADPAEIVQGTNTSTTITCVAADPDDDPLTYSWSASEGTITGTGSQVIWAAPDKSGNFNVALTVADNRGSQATGSVTVNVLPPTKTVTINAVATETGTVDQKNATDYSRTRAGDDALNVGYRAFWSFDTSSLAGKNIKSASLKFSTGSIAGYPFSYNMPPAGLGGLLLWKDTYGSQLPAFGYVGAKLIGTGLMYEPPTAIDVTTHIKQIAAYGVSRFQVEALFTKVSNGNITADMIEWSSVVLEVTYFN